METIIYCALFFVVGAAAGWIARPYVEDKHGTGK